MIQKFNWIYTQSSNWISFILSFPAKILTAYSVRMVLNGSLKYRFLELIGKPLSYVLRIRTFILLLISFTWIWNDKNVCNKMIYSTAALLFENKLFMFFSDACLICTWQTTLFYWNIGNCLSTFGISHFSCDLFLCTKTFSQYLYLSFVVKKHSSYVLFCFILFFFSFIQKIMGSSIDTHIYFFMQHFNIICYRKFADNNNNASSGYFLYL